MDALEIFNNNFFKNREAVFLVQLFKKNDSQIKNSRTGALRRAKNESI